MPFSPVARDDLGVPGDLLPGFDSTEPVGAEPIPRWECEGHPIHCVEDYVALARALSNDDPTLDACASALPDQLVDLGLAEPPFDEWTPAELQADLIAGLAMELFLDGLEERTLEVVLVDEHIDGAVREQTLLATDPLVGTMQWRLLWPAKVPEAGAAILALPGHPNQDDAAQEFIDQSNAHGYAEAGYLVALSSQRAYDSWYAESEANAYLLCAGSSLMAVRHYETLLLDRYLRALGFEEVALLGHSGGSVALNALMRWDWRWSAAITDLESNYAYVLPCDEVGDSPWCLLDEVHPHLASRFPQINNNNLVDHVVPYLRQDYGYPNGIEPVLDFLADHAR